MLHVLPSTLFSHPADSGRALREGVSPLFLLDPNDETRDASLFSVLPTFFVCPARRRLLLLLLRPYTPALYKGALAYLPCLFCFVPSPPPPPHPALASFV